jgi:hypothetical protein
MSVVDDSFGHPLKVEEKATMILAGGIAGQGYQCGMLWGAALAAGAQAFQVFGSDPQAEAAAINAPKRLSKLSALVPGMKSTVTRSWRSTYGERIRPCRY